MEAVAKHDFDSSNEEDLRFKKGTVIKILNMTDDKNLYLAEYEGKEGLVPKNSIQMKPHNWYYGKIERHEAEQLLLGEPHNGAFLIRGCESTAGDFSLSVKFNSQVHHFKVLRASHGKYYLWTLKFNSLNHLIEYYRTATVSESQVIFLKNMKVGRALFDFVQQEDGELQFNKGDLIYIIDKYEFWSTGKRVGSDKIGMFPSNYIQVISRD